LEFALTVESDEYTTYSSRFCKFTNLIRFIYRARERARQVKDYRSIMWHYLFVFVCFFWLENLINSSSVLCEAYWVTFTFVLFSHFVSIITLLVVILKY